MNKISSILPANARVTTVDMRNSGVSRPGSPSFGREVGMSTPAQRKAELETAMKASNEFKTQMYVRNEELDPKSKIVQNMADNFFNKKAAQKNEEVDLGLDEDTDMKVESRPVSFNKELGTLDFKELIKKPEASTDENNKTVVAATMSSTQNAETEEEESPVTGKYLDVRV